MSAWNEYPPDYRNLEVEAIRRAVCAGECFELIGLSGSGKSNLVGFLAHRLNWPAPCPRLYAVDCNRLGTAAPAALFSLIQTSLDPQVRIDPANLDLNAFSALEQQFASLFRTVSKICLVFDRFDRLSIQPDFPSLASNLRALRDEYKYQLTYLIAVRLPLDSKNELAELFFGHSLWLGPLSRSDAIWSARRDAARFSRDGLGWSDEIIDRLVQISGGYPSLLRAVCEAYADGADLAIEHLRSHQAVQKRLQEFWADAPSLQALEKARLFGHPLLGEKQSADGQPQTGETSPEMASLKDQDTSQLTAKENLLLQFLTAHLGQVCEKDDLVRAIWPEDVIFAQGVRDESLAQLVRRLRVKIEPDPASPRFIQTVPGRGYILRKSV
jgi:hypothetical protein